MTGLNYSKELQYMPIEDDMNRGMSRESSSPLDYGSWAHEDATRAKDLYKKGDYAHARALGIDEHDADYAKDQLVENVNKGKDDIVELANTGKDKLIENLNYTKDQLMNPFQGLMGGGGGGGDGGGSAPEVASGGEGGLGG